MSSAFCYAQPKNSLAKDVKIKTLVEKIVQKVSDIPQYKEYKNNVELLKMVCCIVEQEIDNRKVKAKLDKKDIVFQVYTRCWSLNPVDLKDLEANIQYLWENGQIKRKGFLKSLLRTCATGLIDAYYKAVDYCKDYVINYMVDLFLRKTKMPVRVIVLVDTIINLSVYTIVEIILKRYGFLYLLKYVFWLSLL